ncbi:VCBS domain-containing protein, partial [Endozoicomonas ascidiicola]|uniref:VCBS domain-containing protein n=1 Tax=Endozoicomonas ascidiicola TaxID=1698521 RepID=UPI001C12AFA2
ELTSTLSDSGSFTISDTDLTDTQSLSYTAGAPAYLGNFSITLADDTASDGTGQVDWNFDVVDRDIDYLAAGQTLTQTYTVTVDDGIGGTVDQDIVITLTGTNDAPIISSIIDVTGAITEITDGGSGENVTVHVESGSFVISDQDITDSHFISVSANGSDYRGNLSPSINNISGQVDWDFEVSDSDIDYLAAGQILTQIYTVTVSDGEGGSADQDIVITLTGTNDVPIIEAITDVTGSITELGDGISGELTSTLSDSGSFSISDVDHSDAQSVTFASAGSEYLGSFSATVGDNTTGDGSGRIDWNFDVADSDIDYLAAGQTLTQTYTVTVSDGEGGEVDQDIIITLTGTNDAPIIEATTNVIGDITEMGDNNIGELTYTLSDSGSFTIGDVDHTDTQSLSYTAGAADYLGNFSITLADDT